MNDQDKEAKLIEFFERARKGVLKYLNDKGGLLSLGDLHEYSLRTYLIQHQRFSMMMESFVNLDLVIYDSANDEVILTDKGKVFIG